MNSKNIQSIIPERTARVLLAALLFIVLLAVAGCGGGTEPSASQSTLPPVSETVMSQPTVAAEIPFLGEIVPTMAPAATDTPAMTSTPVATATPDVTPTAEGGVVAVAPVEVEIDPQVTVVPFDIDEQPPYEVSECSDKYPCNDDTEGWESRIMLPEGFEATYYARVEGQPNILTFGPDGLLYVATMTGEIYKVNEEGESELYVDGFNAPAGLAFQPGTERLYVSSRVIDQNVDGEAQVFVVEDGVATELITGLPCCYVSMHSANGIAFGPDGYGYVSVGGRADHGEILSGPNAGEQDVRDPYEASILRFSPDGAMVETYARGFRNAYDIAWDADDNLFNTDNMPDFGPPEEFNLVQPGEEHGYPWFDCEVCFPAPDDVDIVPPLHTFIAHSSPTGIAAYLDDEFPGFYNSLFVTLWSAFPEAQRIVWFSPGGEEMASFATGFAAPIDLTVGPDGALYVADWATGIIFRIAYNPQ